MLVVAERVHQVINNTADLTLAIEAPSQYPAGLPVAIDAKLTMTNTSTVDATNLVYNIPAAGQDGNNTGVTITPNAGIGSTSGDCTNIKAGASCTFTATIAPNAKPGSFTVTATPNGSTTQSTKQIKNGKVVTGGSISVTANLGLVDVPSTNNVFYILPSDQVLQGSETKTTDAYVSVWVKSATEGLSQIKLVDESGNALSYTAVGTENFATNSINTYKVTIPAGKTLQHIQALAYNAENAKLCNLNTGDNSNESSTCSNDADVNLASSGVGILNIQPNYFKMSESYTSQVVTLFNIGSATINNLTLPSIDGTPFTITNNNCSNNSLTVGSSCTITLNYSGSGNGQHSYIVNYNNGNSDVNTAVTIPYGSQQQIGVLSTSPSSISLSSVNRNQTISIENTGKANITNLVLPTLSLPLEQVSTTCGNSLSVGQSCTYTIKYTGPASANNTSIGFDYHNGASTQQTQVAIDWSQLNLYTYVANADNVLKCLISESGVLSSCTITPAIDAPEWTPMNIVKETVNNVEYAYIAGDDGVHKCSVDNSTDELTNCNQVESNITDIHDIEFATVNGNKFVYLVPSDYATELYYCSVSNDGTFGECKYALEDSDMAISGVTLATFAGKQYAYLSNYGYGNSVWKCPVNNDGTFSNGTLNTGSPDGCVRLDQVDSSVPAYPFHIRFRNVANTDYAYVSGYKGIFQCMVDQQSGNFSGCVNTPDPQPNPLDDYSTINFQKINGIEYAFISDEYRMYRCNFNTISGAFSSCNLQDKPTTDSNLSWYPHEIMFN
ncbi:MAG: hypothetical protein RLZZ293_446 [Pseudomonadota bacterium]